MSRPKQYSVRVEGEPTTQVIAKHARGAACAVAQERWDSEEWDGDHPLVVYVRNSEGVVTRYAITAEIEVRMLIKSSTELEGEALFGGATGP